MSYPLRVVPPAAPAPLGEPRPPTPEQYKALSEAGRINAARLARLRLTRQATEERLIIARTKATEASIEFYAQSARVDRLAAHYQTIYGTTPERGAERLAAATADMARFNAEHPGWDRTSTARLGHIGHDTDAYPQAS
jgi:hypothetical protein